MAELLAVTTKIKTRVVNKIKFVAGKGYVQSMGLPTHHEKTCTGINQVRINSIKFIQNEDGTYTEAPKQKFNVTEQVCATCGEILDARWDG